MKNGLEKALKTDCTRYFVIECDKFIEYETDNLDDALRIAQKLKGKHEKLSYCVAAVVARIEFTRL